MNLTDEQKVKMRAFLREQGRAVEFTKDGRGYQPVSTYGWHDHDAWRHTSRLSTKYPESGGCTWVVEPGVVLREVVYSMFADTFSGNDDEVGVECAPVHCACGKYTDVTLRWVGSLGDLMHAIFGPVVPDTGVTL